MPTQNGDGVVSMAEFEANLKPKTRAAIEAKLNEGWVFDKARWDASVARHAKWNMAKVFKQFDFDGDGYLDIGELRRAFRALGLKKRSGAKMGMDEATFRSFDTNGDGERPSRRATQPRIGRDVSPRGAPLTSRAAPCSGQSPPSVP